MVGKVQIGVRVSEETRDILKRIAEDNARTLNGEVELLIREHIRRSLADKPELQHQIQFKKGK